MTVATEHDETPSNSGRLSVVSCQWQSRRRALGWAALEFAVYFGQELTPHLLARRVVEPVQKDAATAEVAQTPIGVAASTGQVAFDLCHRLQVLALPSAVAEGACAFDSPIAEALQGRRDRGNALQESWIVAL
jgi:hypothetical protein